MTKKNPVKVCKSVGLASDLLKSVANPNRLAILCYLMEKQCTVAELEEDLGMIRIDRCARHTKAECIEL